MINIKKIDHDENRVVLEMDNAGLARIIESYWNYIDKEKHEYIQCAREYNTLSIAKEILQYGKIDKVRLQLAIELLNKCSEMEPF